MYIALCDSNPQDLKQLADIVRQYASSCTLPIRFQAYLDAEHMLQAAKEERFTHYFLAAMMPTTDGITAAHEIRSFDLDAKIVFLSAFKEFAYESYRVRAHDYLLKPAKRQDILALLSELNTLDKDAQECLCIQNGRSFFRIPFSMLSHVEVNRKRLYFRLKDGQTRQICGTLSDFEDILLSRPEFVKIHRSYIVNLRQISILSPKGCRMFSGQDLPVSRLLYQRVQRAFAARLSDPIGGGGENHKSSPML